MSALTQERNTPRRIDSEYSLPVAAGVVIYAGAIVAMSGGFAHPAAGFVSQESLCVGVATETIDNSTGNAGEKNIVVARDGAFFFKHDGSVDYNTGITCQALDDQTLTAASDNGEDGVEKRYYPGGCFIRETTDSGVWVKFGY